MTVGDIGTGRARPNLVSSPYNSGFSACTPVRYECYVPGPTMTRQASRDRAERVVLARAVMRTPWREIMRTEGFKSVGAVQTTYYREMARRKRPAKALADMTAQEILERRDVTTRMAVSQLMEARRNGDVSGVAAMLREIRQNDVETAKMLGLYAPEQLDVTVDSAPVLAATTEWLRQINEAATAAVGGGQPAALSAGVIDAEVIER